jgi:hypothetical protein
MWRPAVSAERRECVQSLAVENIRHCRVRPVLPDEKYVTGGHYFSPRLLCRFDLTVKAISIRRRMEIGSDLLTYDLFFSTLLWLGSERNLNQAANCL